MFPFFVVFFILFVAFLLFLFFFFFNDTATTEIYTLSLHDALPIWWAARRERARGGAKPGGAGREPGRGGDGGRSQLCSGDPHCGWEGTGSMAGAGRRGGGAGPGGGGGRASPLSSRGSRGGWERPLRALLGPQGSASSGRSGGLRTTGQGTGTAWSREPRSPPSVGTTWRSQKGLAFGLKALTAPPLC